MDKRTLTLDDLYNLLCNSNPEAEFDSDATGYQLAVSVPAVLETYEHKVSEDPTLAYYKVDIFHAGKNRNGSIVTEAAAKKCMDGIANKPLLANFTEIDDEGTLDFTTHNYEIKDGKKIFHETQIGNFTASPAWIEEKDDKKFVCAIAAIPVVYSPTVDILTRKGGSKVSAELLINKFAWDATTKTLTFKDITLQGCVLLGVNPTTKKEVTEGMEGANISLIDFAKNKNSAIAQFEDCNGKEVNGVDTKNTPISETQADGQVADYDASADAAYIKTFEMSHEDIRVALYKLLRPIEAVDDECYYIMSTFDDHFVYRGDRKGKIYGQKYTSENDVIAFDGDRYPVRVEYLTEDEYQALQTMRTEFSALQEYKTENENAKAHAEREALLSDAKFACISESADFAALREKMDSYELADLEKEAKCILADHISEIGNFAAQDKTTTPAAPRVKLESKTTPKRGKYGNIFIED